ncbi:lipid II:glycine glycyltransferase FemX [Calditrichota bacterium LG25]
MFRIVKNISEINLSQWAEFVEKHPNGNIFQTPQMFEFYQKVPNYTPYIFCTVDSKGEIVGILLAVVIKEAGIAGFFSSRCIVWGGPLINEGDLDKRGLILNLLFKNLHDTVSKNSIYTEFRNLFDLHSEQNFFNNFKFKYEDHLDIHIYLNVSLDMLMKKMHKERRHNIRRAINKGVVFREVVDKKDIYYGYDLIRKLYDRIKLPVPSLFFFISAFETLQPEGSLKVFSAEYKGKIISIRFILCFRDTLFDWYVGTDQNYLKYYPNDFLPYKIMEWGIKEKYTLFDFGGAGKPNIPYGVRDFKLKFGGVLVNYGRYLRINNKFLYYLGKLGIKFYPKLKF